MKRILTLLCLTVILVCCDMGPRQSSASVSIDGISYLKRVIHKIDSIEYHLYYTGSYDGGVDVINHTKELLEIELIKKQIDEIDKGNQE